MQEVVIIIFKRIKQNILKNGRVCGDILLYQNRKKHRNKIMIPCLWQQNQIPPPHICRTLASWYFDFTVAIHTYMYIRLLYASGV